MTQISEEDALHLLSIAKASIEHGLRHGAPVALDPSSLKPLFLSPAETALAIKWDKKNLGCILNFQQPVPLYESVLTNAFNAAFRDYRFPAVNPNVLSKAILSLSVFDPVKRYYKDMSLSAISDLVKPDDSLQLHCNNKTAVMCSYMQAHFATVEEFVISVRDKAKIPKQTEWNEVSFTLSKTTITEKPFIDIPCLNTE